MVNIIRCSHGLQGLQSSEVAKGTALNTLLVVALLAAVVVIIFLLYERWSWRAQHSMKRHPRENLLQVEFVPEDACEAVRKLESQRYRKDVAPDLPLKQCSKPASCSCRYKKVSDRRIGERRSGNDQRESIRYEENPRRKGRGGRAEDQLFTPEDE